MILRAALLRICDTCTKKATINGFILQNRCISLSVRNKSKEVSKHVRRSETLGQKAKETAKNTYYGVIILAATGVFVYISYHIFNELLSSFSPQKIYKKAVRKVEGNEKVIELLGEPIKFSCKKSKRGRLQLVNNLPYQVGDVKGYRIEFYAKGYIRSGTISLDARKTPDGWDYRYIYLKNDSYPGQVIIIEDNRSWMDFTEADSLRMD